jgi:hypothetical protein
MIYLSNHITLQAAPNSPCTTTTTHHPRGQGLHLFVTEVGFLSLEGVYSPPRIWQWLLFKTEVYRVYSGRPATQEDFVSCFFLLESLASRIYIEEVYSWRHN